MRQPLNPRDLELAQMPSIASQLPVLFANDTQLTSFSATCSRCSQELEQCCVHGSISRPTSRLAVIEAVGICRDCNLLIRYLVRVYDDFTALTPTANGWQWFHPVKTSRLDRLLRTLLKTFRRGQRPF